MSEIVPADEIERIEGDFAVGRTVCLNATGVNSKILGSMQS